MLQVSILGHKAGHERKMAQGKKGWSMVRVRWKINTVTSKR
jgi:hypothetical protein